MTEKRFAYIKNSSITQYQSIPIQKIGKGKPFHCQGLVDELNKLWNENEELKQENQFIKHVINEALTAERTELGKSVLKKLAETLEIL